MNKIVITGAFGFLGTHLCRYFEQQGYEVIALGRHSRYQKYFDNLGSGVKTFPMELPSSEFETILQNYRPQYVVHCAGPASVPYSVKHPLADFQQGVGNWAFVLDAIRRIHPECHIGFVSSASVYGNPKDLPVSEDAVLKPLSPYGYHKILCETLAEEYTTLFDLKISVFRLFSAYGEGLYKQVVFDLLKKFYENSNSFVELFGTGEESRDFIHGHDVAKAIKIVFDSSSNGIFNIGSGVETTISTIASHIKNLLNDQKEIRFNGKIRQGDPRFWKSDIQKIVNLGYAPSIGLEKGLEQTYSWFRNTSFE